MKILVIAEKNEVANAILKSKYPGKRSGKYWTCDNNIKIFATNGHMMRLKMPEEYNSKWKAWSNETLPLYFVENYEKVPIESRQEDFEILIDLIKNCDLIIHAGDCDDEGQIIVDEICHYARKQYNIKVPIKRVFIRDNEPKTIIKAFDKLVDNDTQESIGLAAEGKSVLDLLFGINITRACTIAAQKAGYDDVMYCGRVQSPVQGLVVRRDREIEAHKKAYYHNLSALFSIDNLEINARYKINEHDPVDDKNRIINKSYLEQIGIAIKNKEFNIESINTVVKKIHAPLPFNMAVAISTINQTFKLPIPIIDETLQNLRLVHNLITYSRSDCRYLSEEIFENAPSILESLSSNNVELGAMIQKADPSFRSRAIDSQKAPVHHGIIPTSHQADLSKLTEIEFNIYMLICKTFIAQFMPLHEYEHTKVIINAQGYTFEATSNKVLINGWKDIYTSSENENDETDDEVQNVNLQEIKSNIGICSNFNIKDKETTAKKRYTVATLINDMNSIAKYCTDPRIKKLLLEKDSGNDDLKGSIGTSATQKEIIPAQFTKGMFVEDAKGYISSTKICRDLFDMLPPEITNPDITALWYEQQKLVENKKLSVKEFIDTSYIFIAEQVNKIKSTRVKLSIDVVKCPKCEHGILKRNKGEYGYYWYCNEYKDGCDYRTKDLDGKPDFTPKQVQLSGNKCPKCSSDMVFRVGKHGQFEACSSYPNCTYRVVTPKKTSTVKGTSSIKRCKNCNKPMIKRKLQTNSKEVYVCTGYPTCKTVEDEK